MIKVKKVIRLPAGASLIVLKMGWFSRYKIVARLSEDSTDFLAIAWVFSEEEADEVITNVARVIDTVRPLEMKEFLKSISGGAGDD